MMHSMILDGELLERYAKDQDQDAFAELVRRHLDGVFSAALRRVGGDQHLAEDVAQHVFIELARQSRRLVHHPVLTGWLYVTTRNQAVMLVRTEQRRKRRETEAHLMNEPQPELSSDDWSRIAPVLDWAIEQLPETDRTAVLLRFVGRKPFEEIGSTLKVSSDAARMRVDRAIDKLRSVLARKGIVSTTSLLAVGLTRHAAAAAPASLSASVTAAGLATLPAAAGLLPAAIQFMANSKMISGVAATLVIAATLGTAGFSLRATREAQDTFARETEQIGTAEKSVSTLTQKLAQSEAEISALQKQLNDRAAALAAAEAERKRSSPPDPKTFGTEFMQRHPEVKQALVAWFDEQAMTKFKPLFEKFHLTPEQIEQFLVLAHENNWFGRAPDPTTNRYAQFSVNSGLSDQEVTTRLRALIGRDGMKDYWDTFKRQSVTELTAKTAAGLVFSENPLTTSQAAQLTDVFSKYRQSGSDGPQFDWDKIEADARNVLSPAQLGVIDALRDEDELQKAYNSSAATGFSSISPEKGK